MPGQGRECSLAEEELFPYLCFFRGRYSRRLSWFYWSARTNTSFMTIQSPKRLSQQSQVCSFIHAPWVHSSFGILDTWPGSLCIFWEWADVWRHSRNIFWPISHISGNDRVGRNLCQVLWPL